MKKLFSLVLAVAMVMSLAAVAFAAVPTAAEADQIWGIYDDVYLTESDSVLKNAFLATFPIPFGKTAYFPLFCADNKKGYTDDTTFNLTGITAVPASQLVLDYDIIKGIKPKLTYEMGSSYIDSVEIVKKKQNFVQDNSGKDIYAYFVAVKVKSSTSTSKYDVIGEITMKKSGQVYKNSDLVEGADFSFSVGYEVATDYTKLTKDPLVYNFGEKSGSDYLYQEEDYELELYGDAGYFIINTIGQGKLVLWNDTKFNSDVAALYPDANLDFVIGSGTSFNKTGELYLYADEDTFVYALKADGTLAKVKAEYDEYEEAWVVKTRTLGSYVISDAELTLAPAVVAEPATPAEPANPGTGAAA